MALVGTEMLWVVAKYNGSLAAEEMPTTTGEIAKLAGSGGISTTVEITSGSSVNGVLGTFYGFNSSTNATKDTPAPPATGSRGIIKAQDFYGDAGGNNVQGPNNIVFVPNGGDIVMGTNAIYTSGGLQIWQDFAPGIWSNG